MDVWFDKDRLLPGQNWEYEISQAIEKSSYFLALLSSHSVSKRGYVQKELKKAFEILSEFPSSDVFLIPVRVDECEVREERLKNLHWADLFESYEEELDKIFQTLQVEEELPKTESSSSNSQVNPSPKNSQENPQGSLKEWKEVLLQMA